MRREKLSLAFISITVLASTIPAQNSWKHVANQNFQERLCNGYDPHFVEPASSVIPRVSGARVFIAFLPGCLSGLHVSPVIRRFAIWTDPFNVRHKSSILIQRKHNQAFRISCNCFYFSKSGQPKTLMTARRHSRHPTRGTWLTDRHRRGEFLWQRAVRDHLPADNWNPGSGLYVKLFWAALEFTVSKCEESAPVFWTLLCWASLRDSSLHTHYSSPLWVNFSKRLSKVHVRYSEEYRKQLQRIYFS